jgi:hypothetical protein
MRIRAMSCSYRNEPATLFRHLGLKLGETIHRRNMRPRPVLFQPSLPWLGLTEF